MESLQSLALLPVATMSQSILEENIVENQRQAQLSLGDGGENDKVDENECPSLSTRSASCNDVRRRGEGEQLRQSRSEEEEPEVVLPATITSLSRKSLFVLRPVHRYVDLVCISLSVLAYLLETTMNAALAIFGIGVGVGLVLGDSFRAALPLLPSVQSQQQQQGMAVANASTMAAQAGNEIMMPRSVSNLLPAQ